MTQKKSGSPLGNIEAGILKGDWALVCAGFNRLTGKDLKPPVIKPKVKVKKDYYEEAKKYNPNLPALGKISIEELKEIILVNSFGHEEAELEEAPVVEKADQNKQLSKAGDQGYILDGFRFVRNPSKLLADDKAPVKAQLDPRLAAVVDGLDEYAPRKPAVKTELICNTCSKPFLTYEKGIRLDDGQRVGLCNHCATNL